MKRRFWILDLGFWIENAIRRIDEIQNRHSKIPNELALAKVAAIDASACISYTLCMQYTLRQIPREVDAAIRRKAKSERKSLNQAALDALRNGAGVGDQRMSHHDLDALAGTWVEDAQFDAAIKSQDRVDPSLWK